MPCGSTRETGCNRTCGVSGGYHSSSSSFDHFNWLAAMIRLDVTRDRFAFFRAAIGVLLLACGTARAESAELADPAELADLHGGLIVQIGGGDVSAAAKLSLTGRYLIHVLDDDDDQVTTAQRQLRDQGYYGLAWAERRLDPRRLPYAENIVNLVYQIDDEQGAVPADELMRVLTPGGHLVIAKPNTEDRAALEASGFDGITDVGSALVARKPWPGEMDIWSHPRHAADGNAVSLDTLVGPPERVRWIAAATSEVEGMVTAGGRNFYGGLLARDSFNGLRLWHRTLNRADALNTDEFQLPRIAGEGSRPVVSRTLVFAVIANRPVALDAATGEVVVELGDGQRPTAMVHDGVRVIVADGDSVRAFDVDTGKQKWTLPAAEPQQLVADGRYVSLIRGQVRRGEKAEAVVVDGETGEVLWQRDDYPWLTRTTRTVMAGGVLVFEVSSLSDHDQGNGIHVVEIETGKHLWSKEFAPGMNHARQARAMYLDGDLWILHGGKVNTSDEQNRSRAPDRDLGARSADRRNASYASRWTDPLFSTGRHAQLHVRRRIGYDRLEQRRSDRQPHHQSQLFPRKWLDPRQRIGLHDTETLHLLADVTRLRGDGTRVAGPCVPRPPAGCRDDVSA